MFLGIIAYFIIYRPFHIATTYVPVPTAFALHCRTFRGPIFVFENERDTLKKVHLTKPKIADYVLSLFYA